MRTDRFDRETVEQWQARLRRQSAFFAEEADHWGRRAAKFYRRRFIMHVTQIVLVLMLAGLFFFRQFLLS